MHDDQRPVPGKSGSRDAAPNAPRLGIADSPHAMTGYAQVPCISSEQLLAGANEIHIAHRGALYRLKQTSLGKLILTK